MDDLGVRTPTLGKPKIHKTRFYLKLQADVRLSQENSCLNKKNVFWPPKIGCYPTNMWISSTVRTNE